jgi:HlyD family secretion protein
VAPTDGLVYERLAAIGGLTDGSQPLFRIARNGEVEAQAEVPEAMVRRVRPAMPVSLEIAGNPALVSGSVRLITPRVDRDSRATSVRISFKRNSFTPVGVFCEASITVAQVGGWVLPGTALQLDTRGMFVWVVSAQHNVVRTAVTVVVRTPESVVIEETLGGRSIVAKAGSFLKEGDLVAVTQDR